MPLSWRRLVQPHVKDLSGAGILKIGVDACLRDVATPSVAQIHDGPLDLLPSYLARLAGDGTDPKHEPATIA